MNREPEDISIEEMRDAYNRIKKFREYVDEIARDGSRRINQSDTKGSRLKSIDEVLINKTVRYYYLSILPGEINEERG